MYKVKLENFEGPLDLLLFFIKRDELDIYDIPISYITAEFMKYLEIIEQLDLEVAGDFILMASTLMQIKAKMLLPKEKNERGEEIDPRQDLIDALIEYKRYKEVSDELAYKELEQRKFHYRGNYDSDEKESPEELDTLLKNVTIYDLMKAFKKALTERPKEAVHTIELANVSVDEQIDHIMGYVEDGKEVGFLELINGMFEKLRIIVTFIALLELVKMGKIGIRETNNFNDFSIYGLIDG